MKCQDAWAGHEDCQTRINRKEITPEQKCDACKGRIVLNYADTRYEVLNMGNGMTKVIAYKAVTRWSDEAWEVGTHGKYTCDLNSALANLGCIRPNCISDAGAMVSEYHDKTGCDWSTALVACNCD